MSDKRHCDICDDVIRFDLATVDYTRSQDLDGKHHLDLCQAHYNSFYQTMEQWKKFEQGFVASWPTRRVNA